MANEEHLKILREGAEAWNQWRKENPTIIPNLDEADLSRIGLIFGRPSPAEMRDLDSYFSGDCFKRANLSKVSLVGANFYGLIFSGFDLSEANLSNANLVCTSLIRANLSGANLRNANLNGANLRMANLNEADCSGASFRSAFFGETTLNKTIFRNSILSRIDLSRTDLRNTIFSNVDFTGTSFSGADLSGANLSASLVSNADFTNATLTGACIAGWQIDSSTKIDGVICDHVYRKINEDKKFVGRIPTESNRPFFPGEFELWAKFKAVALETVDLIFSKGINWQRFFRSLQEVRAQNPETNIFLQGIEEKNGRCLVRLRIEPEKLIYDGGHNYFIKNFPKRDENIDENRTFIEAKIETNIKDLYRKDQQLSEDRGEAKNLMQSLEQVLHMATNQGSKYNLQGAQFAGGFAETVQGNQIGGVINNYGQNAEDIIRLLTSLREQAQAFPTEHKEEALDLLNDLETDLKKPEPDTNRMGRKLKRFAEIATTIGILTAGAVTFSGNLNEVVGNVIKLTEVLGIPIEQVQPNQILPEDTTY